MNLKPNLTILRNVLRNVCGIGYVSEPLPDNFSPRPDEALPIEAIVGTGFLVGSGLVVTARHVFESLRTLRVTQDRVIFVFADYADPQVVWLHLQRGVATNLIITPPHEQDPESKSPAHDVVWLEMKEPLVNSGPIMPPVGLTPLEPEHVYVGKPLIVPGYYAGDSILSHWNMCLRHGPIVLHGHIAAISPVGLEGTKASTEYLVDITAAGGISGAPVIEPETGRVLAMMRGEVSHKVTKQALDVGFALPLSAFRLSVGTAALAEAKRKRLGT